MINGNDIEKIAQEAAQSAVSGIVSGAGSVSLDYMLDIAKEADSAARELMKYDEKFGKALKTFFERIIIAISEIS